MTEPPPTRAVISGEELRGIEERAEAARNVPQPWFLDTGKFVGPGQLIDIYAETVGRQTCIASVHRDSLKLGAHIAGLSPSVVLALVAALRQAWAGEKAENT